MAKRVITFELSPDSIDDAIKQIYAYKKDFEEKCARLRKKFSERIAWSAASGFRSATHADVIHGTPEPNDVTVEVTERGDISVVIASGKEAVFIEFGAGISNNGAVGTSPHPWSEVNPEFTIGSYGQGKGARAVWGYYAGGVKSKDTLVITRGTPAAMPMFRGAQEAIAVLHDIVEEVFGE